MLETKKAEELESKRRLPGRPTKEESAKIAQERLNNEINKANEKAQKKAQKKEKAQKKGKGLDSDTEEEISRFKNHSEPKHIKGFTQIELPKHIYHIIKKTFF